MNSSAALRIVARVRSDFVILDESVGAERSFEGNRAIPDEVSVNSDILSTFDLGETEPAFSLI